MKTQNEGIRTYQENKRQETLSRIDEAYQYLKESHLSITKKALSDTSGIPLRTIHQPYVQQYLLQYPEFNPDSALCDSTVFTTCFLLFRTQKDIQKQKKARCKVDSLCNALF